jgi:HSP20 family molecular chaperone IbpA
MWYTNHIKYTFETNSDSIIYRIELPGKSKEDIKIYNRNNEIELDIKDHGEFIIDASSDNYSRPTYYNIENFDLSKAKAKMAHGLLTITIPKKTGPEKRIEIE